MSASGSAIDLVDGREPLVMRLIIMISEAQAVNIIIQMIEDKRFEDFIFLFHTAKVERKIKTCNKE